MGTHTLENAEGGRLELENKSDLGTHILESTAGRTDQKTERKRALGEEYSLPGEHGERFKSGHKRSE
jgi:hypothetical protein